MASFLYNRLYNDLADGTVQESDNFRMTLHTATYTPNKDDDTGTQATNELSGGGYTTGGETCTMTVTTDDANDRTSVSFSAPTFSAITTATSGEPRYAVVRKDVSGTNSSYSTDPVVALLDFGSNIQSSGGDIVTSETSPFYINH